VQARELRQEIPAMPPAGLANAASFAPTDGCRFRAM
jgi:hypothetical protein